MPEGATVKQLLHTLDWLVLDLELWLWHRAEKKITTNTEKKGA